MERLLVGDIGGSNTRLGLVLGGELQAVVKWRTSATRGLGEAVRRYREVLEAGGLAPGWDAAAVAVAGPVSGARARLTNVEGWEASPEDLGAPGVILNDLAAVAWALPVLGEEDVETLCGPEPVPGAPAVVVGVGTGLGAALFVGGQAVPGEGGHADFAPPGPAHDSLLSWLRGELPGAQVTVEHVLSGPGLGRLLRYAATCTEPAPEVRRILDGPAAPASEGAQPLEAVVSAWNTRCPACRLATELFVEALGGEVAGLGLRVLARGGIYLCGGVAQRLAPALRTGLPRVLARPEADMAALRSALPVRLVTHPDPALVGAAAAARAHLAE